MKKRITLLYFYLIIGIMTAKSQEAKRIDLANFQIESQLVNRIEVKEIKMQSGQKASIHSHPCNVVGHIISGTVFYQKEGEKPLLLEAGDVFYEPKNVPILHFDNASVDEPLIFIAYYLLEDDEDLIEFPQNSH